VSDYTGDDVDDSTPRIASVRLSSFVVLKSKRSVAVYYLPTDFQTTKLFRKRKALSARARRAGWQGFHYRLDSIAERLVRLFPTG
jgi:type II restriction enzyme